MFFPFVLVTPAMIKASPSPKIYHSFILAKREISERALYFVLTQESSVQEEDASRHGSPNIGALLKILLLRLGDNRAGSGKS